MNLSAVFELRRAMVKGERTIFDPVTSVTRTEAQHDAAIDRAVERAKAASGDYHDALVAGSTRRETLARRKRDAAMTEIKRLVDLKGARR